MRRKWICPKTILQINRFIWKCQDSAERTVVVSRTCDERNFLGENDIIQENPLINLSQLPICKKSTIAVQFYQGWQIFGCFLVSLVMKMYDYESKLLLFFAVLVPLKNSVDMVCLRVIYLLHDSIPQDLYKSKLTRPKIVLWKCFQGNLQFLYFWQI